ncbi:IS66 family transposase Orf1 [Myxococcus stipitatus DSM 14675]|uniref:IS66 family transposase Orf1 n=1 Tax=Myxococcus stipitatus (strain DSM 14675 / JCM 12634 / Mx s8) TaxID=1278073 RepID=L7U5Q5_MYXSD|nr:IS66 family insertion sequence element accessory protein TnpB [Myxococcus stipitatus]AGC41814.1 IS66 family transposase Orf1 [Myxococcus stipitatus DSM 14675]
MFTLPASVRVVLATEAVDMRKSIEGLMALVKSGRGEDVYSGHLFAFVSRRGDRIKVLTWSRGGLVLLYKRMETGRFRLPKVDADASAVHLDAARVRVLVPALACQQGAAHGVLFHRTQSFGTLECKAQRSICARNPEPLILPSPFIEPRGNKPGTNSRH